jgi:hypothetical protein
LIIGVWGPKGAGKDALCAYLAFKGHRNGRLILSNTALRFPFKWVKRSDLVSRKAQLANCVLYLGEVQTFMDARMHATKGNIEASYLFMQSRKRNVTVLWNTQRLRQVEVRLKENTDYLYEIQRENRQIPFGEPGFNPWAFVTVTDLDNDQIVQKFWFNITKAFPLYDSFQIIDPMLLGDS